VTGGSRAGRVGTWRRRAVVPFVALAVALGSAACGKDSPSMFDTKGPESHSIHNVAWLMFGLAGAVYVIVAGFIVVAVMRGRRRRDDEAPSKPEPKDDTFIWFGGIVVPVVILALLAVVTVRTTEHLRRVSSSELRIQVTGKRWWWDVRYPDSGVVTANEIHIPVGRPIDFELLSDNVIHSFWVPQLGGKVDTIPGQTNHLRMQASEPGTYRGECAEYCGIQHANMNYLVIAETPADFDRWMARRTSGAGLAPTSDETARGQVVFSREACAGCHTIPGTQASGTIGPDLSEFGNRQTIGALTVPNTPDNLRRWITDPDGVKPGNLMPPTALSPEDLAAVVAYLEGLK
jgi:cytochrome c oxidase subunit 2